MANPYRGDRIVVHKKQGFWMLSVVDAEGRMLSTSSAPKSGLPDEKYKALVVERAKGLAAWIGIDQVEVRDE